MNRRDKIKLLQTVQVGKPINNFLTQKLLIKVEVDGPATFYRNGKPVDKDLFFQHFRNLPKPLKFNVIE